MFICEAKGTFALINLLPSYFASNGISISISTIYFVIKAKIYVCEIHRSHTAWKVSKYGVFSGLHGNIWNAPLKKLFTKKSNKVNQTEQIFCKHLISVFIVSVIILLHGVNKKNYAELCFAIGKEHLQM